MCLIVDVFLVFVEETQNKYYLHGAVSALTTWSQLVPREAK